MTNKKTTFIYVGLAASILVAIFYFIKSNSLQNQLELQRLKEEKASKVVEYNRQLLQIDSLLVDGEYKGALEAYNTKIDNKDMDDVSGVQLRIAIAQQLLSMRADKTSNNFVISLDSLDSVQSRKLDMNLDINRYDSLNFALEKARVQLKSMRMQLQKKSFGEYLNFESSKKNQMHYVGQVKNNKANGVGVAILNTGSRYEGEWKENNRHGEGTFYWPDGEYYVGGYLDDKRNGMGTYYWPNGEKYVGQWKNDKRNGKGVFYGNDGEVITKGIWENDKLITPEKN